MTKKVERKAWTVMTMKTLYHNSFFAESDTAGISAWDLLGEGFEHEAAAACSGQFLIYKSSIH